MATASCGLHVTFIFKVILPAIFSDLIPCSPFFLFLIHRYCLYSMNPEVQAGLSISGASPPATQMNCLQPTPTTPCPSSPSPVRQTPRTTLIRTYNILSTHMPPTVTPHMTSGQVMVGVPVRSRTFHVTEPVHSLSTGTFWVGVAKYAVVDVMFFYSELFCSFLKAKQDRTAIS